MRFTDILMSSAHAYIIEGKQGESRNKFIQDFIKGLNCEDNTVQNRPCNSCTSCRQIDAGTSMDVFRLEKNDKGNYVVKTLEYFIERLGMGAYGRHIIGVIDDADILDERLQNKLLKTLEEPEEGAVILLATSNKDNLLQTVRSRCNVVRIADFVQEEETTAVEMSEYADRFLSGCKFYELRDLVDKIVKSQENAMELLGAIEDILEKKMLAGERRQEMAQNIDLVEKARVDIYKGMKYDKALRRLFLELV